MYTCQKTEDGSLARQQPMPGRHLAILRPTVSHWASQTPRYCSLLMLSTLPVVRGPRTSAGNRHHYADSLIFCSPQFKLQVILKTVSRSYKVLTQLSFSSQHNLKFKLFPLQTYSIFFFYDLISFCLFSTISFPFLFARTRLHRCSGACGDSSMLSKGKRTMGVLCT